MRILKITLVLGVNLECHRILEVNRLALLMGSGYRILRISSRAFIIFLFLGVAFEEGVFIKLFESNVTFLEQIFTFLSSLPRILV